METVSLRDLAVLVSVSMGAYSPKIMDKAETKKINDHNNAKGTPHKVIRDRLSGTTAGDILGDIIKAQGEARRLFYEKTLPWDDSGRRMAGTEHAYHLVTELREHEQTVNSHIERFAMAWPNAEAEARTVLNGGWKNEYGIDYHASPDTMRRKFKFKVELESMPKAEDLRMQAPDAMLAEIMKQTEATITARFNAGCKDAHQRLYEAIAAIHAKLSDDKAVFRDSLVGNLKDLIGLLPVLNIGKDPELTRIANSAKTKLLSFDLPPSLAGMPEATPSTETLARKLREDPIHRRDTASAASKILTEMSMYLGAH